MGGSALLPPNASGRDPACYRPAGPRVYNTGVVADPEGRIVHTVAKVNLVPGQEDHIGLTPGRAEDVGVFPFAGTNVGVLICYDAFTRAHTASEPGFCPLAPALAAQGAGILVQPAANPWPWERPWPLDPTRLRRLEWEQEALEAAMAALPGVRFGVTAHLLAGFFGAPGRPGVSSG